MEKYYKLAEEKVINTVTTIPEHMWERKGLLPFERIINTEFVTEPRENESVIDIQIDKVIETVTRYKVAKTFDEVKRNKIREIRYSCEEEISGEYSLYDMSIAGLGMMTIPKTQEMKNFIQTQLDKRSVLIAEINSLETIEEINLIGWE